MRKLIIALGVGLSLAGSYLALAKTSRATSSVPQRRCKCGPNCRCTDVCFCGDPLCKPGGPLQEGQEPACPCCGKSHSITDGCGTPERWITCRGKTCRDYGKLVPRNHQHRPWPLIMPDDDFCHTPPWPRKGIQPEGR